MAEANGELDGTRAQGGMTDVRAIDMWAPIVPVPEVMEHVAHHFPKEMAGYLRVFYKREPDPAEFERIAAGMTIEEETVIEALDQAGIARTLITGFDEFSSVHETFIPNEPVAALAERHPDRFIPFAGADVLAGMDAVRDFEAAGARPRVPGAERPSIHDRPARG